MTTGATLFSGGELVGVGMRNAGINHLWGIEINDQITQVARDNGFHTITADILATNPADFDTPDILHASPVCTNASVANTNGKEAEIDILAAEKTAEFIRVLQPRVFTLENVCQYRKFQSFDIICDQLAELGYWLHYANLCAADFGVPQTRRRLILRAVRGSLLPPLPEKERWVGWYEAIEDLIPGLPDSEFAPWQLKRLKELDTALFAQGCYGDYLPRSTKKKPSLTITANSNQSGLKAFIVDGKLNNRGESKTRRGQVEPTFTVTTSHNNRDVKALLVGDQQRQYANGDTPAHTVRALSGGGAPPRGLISGRVVKMTPRTLARFQSIPDDYRLPELDSLAITIIGNAVPPLMYQKIISQLVELL